MTTQKHERRLSVVVAGEVCRKRAHTKDGAKKTLKTMRAYGADGALEAYRCQRCSQWHLGHPTQTDMLRKRGLLQAS